VNAIAIEFSRRSDEQAESAATLFESADFATNPKKQALFVVGKTSANMLRAMAELSTFMAITDRMGVSASRQEKRLEQSNAIRVAVAAGNWDEFDRLVQGGDGAD
jgi:hypothetical protein